MQTRLRAIACAAAMAFPMITLAQDKTPTQFDVIAIKPHKTGDTSSWWRWTSSGLEMTNVSVKNMIAVSSDVRPWLVFGLPSWTDATRWDILAKVTDPESKPIDKVTSKERVALIGSILHDRFNLVSHTESKVQPVFLMTVMPDGLKIKQSPPPPPGEPEPKFGRGSFVMNDGVAEAKNIHLSDLADTLSGQVERNVIDKTGLTGEYDFKFKWQPEDRAKGGDNRSAESDAPMTIIEAVKEQLGLKMTSDKAPVPTVVVDTIKQPEAN